AGDAGPLRVAEPAGGQLRRRPRARHAVRRTAGGVEEAGRTTVPEERGEDGVSAGDYVAGGGGGNGAALGLPGPGAIAGSRAAGGGGGRGRGGGRPLTT